MIEAVVFDLDGVLIDSEQLWDEVRREVVVEEGGHWRGDATGAMQGMSSPEWSAYMREALAVDLPPERIADLAVGKLLARYDDGLPLLPGAAEAVERIGRRWPLALASSANPAVIDRVLDGAGLRGCFAAVVSSEEVSRGKPAPDVYFEAARRLGKPPGRCVAVEDSANGIRSAVAAGLSVVALPNSRYPPPPTVLARARLVIGDLADLSVEALEQLGAAGELDERLDEQEIESFPASDPHSDWTGPPR